MLQGTLDMLILKTLVMGPAHGRYHHACNRACVRRLSAGGTGAPCILRYTASKIAVGSLFLGS